MITNHNLYVTQNHADAIESLPLEVQQWFHTVYPAFYEDLSYHNDACPCFHVGNMEDEDGIDRPIVLWISGRYDKGDSLIPGFSLILGDWYPHGDDLEVSTDGDMLMHMNIEDHEPGHVWKQLAIEIEQGILGLGTVEQLKAEAVNDTVETTVNGHDAFDILKGMIR
jgi:hypothetical protein